MAIYKPILFSPATGETRDMLVLQTFSATLVSKVTDYQIRIYNTSGVLLYDSNKITLQKTMYSGERLEHIVPITEALGEIRELKWTLKVWNGLETIDDSELREMLLKNYEHPIVSITALIDDTLSSYENMFNADYFQAQNIEPYKYRYLLYDNYNNLLKNTGWIFNESLNYKFDGFVNGSIYKIKIELYNINNNYTESDFYTFSVIYQEPSLNFIPTVENVEDESCMSIKWSGAYSIDSTVDYVIEENSWIVDAATTNKVGIKILTKTDISNLSIVLAHNNIGVKKWYILNSSRIVLASALIGESIRYNLVNNTIYYIVVDAESGSFIPVYTTKAIPVTSPTNFDILDGYNNGDSGIGRLFAIQILSVNGLASFTTNYVNVGNFALSLKTNEKVFWDDISILENYSYIFLWSPIDNNFNGVITKLYNSDTNHYYEVGFNSVVQKFYKNIDGEITYMSTAYYLDTTSIFLIKMRYDLLVITKL